MYLESSEPEDYKKRDEAIKKKIKEVGSKSKTLKSMSKEVKRIEDPTVKRNSGLVHMIVEESLEMYKEGDMDYKEMVEDIYKSLKAVG
jgi:uncharacterized protein (UPF0216 family)